MSEPKLSRVTMLLMATVAATLVTVPLVSAHDPAWTIPTWTYVAVTNDVIGVNQELTIVFWLNAVPPTAIGAYGDRWTFTVEVTKPDGSKETLGPYTSDPVGSGYATYTPTQVGTYTIVAKFAEHVITGTPVPPTGYYGTTAAYINDTYEASESDPIEVIVQEEPISAWSEAPLPTQFWTRPINNMNRNWAQLAGNWLAGAAQNVGATTNFGYGEGPESAHIMWATPFWSGGVMDARYGDYGYYTGLSYESYGLSPPIILNGKLYYNVQTPPRYGWYCLDLYTGEVEYFHNTTGAVSYSNPPYEFDYSGQIKGELLAFGQIYNYESPNQHGGFPYLWSTTHPYDSNAWMMFDAYTGNWICNIGNVTQTERRGTRTITTGATGTAVYGKDGSILRYNIVNLGTTTPEYYLQVWNTSRAIWYESTWSSNEYWMWRPDLNYTFDGRNGFSLNASIPDMTGASIYAVREDQYVIVGTAGKNNGTYVLQGWLAALNLKADSNGVITPTLLWNVTYTPPETSLPDTVYASLNYGRMSGPVVDPEDGVFLFSESLTRLRWCYSLETGQLLWKSDSEPQMNYYTMSTAIYDGKLFSYGYAGKVIAYDIKTGKILWNYTAAQEGFESPYGNYPLSLGCIADGKLYFYSTEHSPTMPLWRGSYIRCINASNGAELWTISHWGTGFAIADGYLVGLNLYDNQIYCYGKGPSATTVGVQNDVITHGNSVLIKGTVTDQCAGAKAIAEKLGYINGVPAVSDASMRAWMEYLYMQQAMPTDVIGVEVALDALDPNGNFVHIGTVTSDSSGMFKKAFVPEVPGEYTIIATFTGSNSYYGSYAETAIYVEEAPPATSSPEYPQPIDPTWTIIGATIAMIIALAIAAVWIRRK
ncbi:MAG: PQQ-binding-like beta-propeller repeat protein [Candidatus Bathyarchaeota archaeon]|nr:PQQ-binding-like beta-propeller repeat protein [Candidatus Bathyarchaeota archaeon]